MTRTNSEHKASAQQAYAVLRHGGASQARARAELALSGAKAQALEALFRVRPPGRGMDAMRPRFARHAEHVAAVTAAGGFPVLAP